jgi:2-polyprenyl-3-methyl-5-hydroxy-6-metoxy-1,4-benzoquinol methylase
VLHHLYEPIVNGRADAVFGSRMMPDFGGPLRGGMPLYKYIGNRILSAFENRALGLGLTEFHSGYRAYSVRALRQIDFSRMTDEFHFDTEIIIKLAHQGFRLYEVPIPTYYGNEICHVNGLAYAYDVYRAVKRYRATVRSIRGYPEFAEYFVDYPFKENARSSHGIAVRLVGSGQAVLDAGCGDGYVAACLKRNRNTVCGIDLLPRPRLHEAFTQYVCADLTAGLASVAKPLARERFDRILLMDVLGSLPDPRPVLRDCARLLHPAGLVVVSVPNIANISVRLSLLRGSFAYTDRGILDERHLRFYTRATARALITSCDLEIVSEQATTIPLQLALGLNERHPLLRALDALLAVLTAVLPGLFGYQWVFAVRPRSR